MKNAINKPPGMPEWKGFGDLFVKGLVVFVIALLYMIVPLIIFSAIAGFCLAVFEPSVPRVHAGVYASILDSLVRQIRAWLE